MAVLLYSELPKALVFEVTNTLTILDLACAM